MDDNGREEYVNVPLSRLMELAKLKCNYPSPCREDDSAPICTSCKISRWAKALLAKQNYMKVMNVVTDKLLPLSNHVEHECAVLFNIVIGDRLSTTGCTCTNDLEYTIQNLECSIRLLKEIAEKRGIILKHS